MKKILFYSLILVVWFAGATSVKSATDNTYTLLEPLPCLEEGCVGTQPTIEIDQYITYIFKFAIALAVLLATVMIIFGGFQWMFSEVPSVKSDGKGKINDAIYGLIAVLVSYLVLQTIDPRLVNIDTRIAPICTAADKLKGGRCASGQLGDFAKELQDDFRNLALEKRNAVLALEPRRLDLVNLKEDLKKRLAVGEIDRDQFLKQITPINAELADIEVEQHKITSEGLGLTQFNIVHKELYNKAGLTGNQNVLNQYTAEVVADNLRDGKLPTLSPNLIQKQYNEKINEIRAITPQTKNVADYASLLSKQRNFFIAQVKEEVMLHSMLLGVVANGGVAVEVIGVDGTKYTVKYNENKEFIKAKIKIYETLLQNPQNSVDAGIPKEQYDQIMKTRIDMANKLLDSKK